MKKILLISFSFLFIITVFRKTFSQEIIFNNAGIHEPSSIKVTSDDYFIFCGFSKYYSIGKQVGWIVKLKNNVKDTIFNRNYESYSKCTLNYIIETKDGNYLAVGADSAKGGFIIKIKKDGDTVFSKYYDWSGSELKYIYETKEGNFIAAGIKYNPNGNRGWILKLNSSFDTILIDTSYSDTYSFIYVRELNDTGDSIIAIGTVNGSGQDIGIKTIDKNGNVLFKKAYGDNLAQIANSAVFTSDSNYIITGRTERDTLINNNTRRKNFVLLLKLNNNYNSIWQKYYGYAAKENDNLYAQGYTQGNCIIETSDRNYLIAGQLMMNFDGHNGFYMDAVLLKIDTSGNVKKQINWLGPGSLHELGKCVAENQCYYVVASFINETMWWDQRQQGRTWIFSVGKDSLDQIKLSVISPNGSEKWKAGESVLIKWDTGNTIDIKCLKIQFSSNSGKDWITIKDIISPTDSSFEWIVQEINSDSCLVRISECNNCVSDISDSIFTTPVIDEIQKKENNITITPNPLNNTSEIKYTIERSSRVTLSISDNLGIEVKRLIDNFYFEQGTSNISFDASDLSSGVYFCTLKADDYIKTIKFVVIK
ncbi:MAG: T9SS type A sorting domain-containing protein [Bacteroidetes bacterium]|nr:MAG: T9SS type A sorting domain-containing protein [Bacteroidota bacterium]